jgi:hypothetical protein
MEVVVVVVVVVLLLLVVLVLVLVLVLVRCSSGRAGRVGCWYWIEIDAVGTGIFGTGIGSTKAFGSLSDVSFRVTGIAVGGTHTLRCGLHR